MADFERILYFSEPSVKLKGFIVVHSSKFGPAIGGTRMRPYHTEDDALEDATRLAQAMTSKAAAAGLNLGGGKAVIIGDPQSEKTEALLLAYGRVINELGGRYITAEDIGIGVDDLAIIKRSTKWVVGCAESEGGSGDSAPPTALGVFLGMRAAAEEYFGPSGLKGRHVAIQGLGKVGYALAKTLNHFGVQLTVADVNPEATQRAEKEFGATVVNTSRIHSVDADIFSPCAVGNAVNHENIAGIKVKIIAGSANNQLEDECSDSALLHSKKILYIPDFLLNAGGLIHVSEELQPGGFNRQRALLRVMEIYGRVKAVAREVLTNQDAMINTTQVVKKMVDARLGSTEVVAPTTDYFGC